VCDDDAGASMASAAARPGMSLNRSKCEALWIGRRRHGTERPCTAAPGAPNTPQPADATATAVVDHAAAETARAAADAARIPRRDQE
jgi:hypothetical protein